MNFADLNWQEMMDATVATIKMIFFPDCSQLFLVYHSEFYCIYGENRIV